MDIASKIVKANGEDNPGLILRYDKPTGKWIDHRQRVLSELTGGLATTAPNYLSTLAANLEQEYLNRNRPLVLLSEWSSEGESIIPDAGFSEAAADALFASLVQLDLALGGSIGQETSSGLRKLYDDQGKLIRHQGALLNSPLHFIGFSRRAVVNC